MKLLCSILFVIASVSIYARITHTELAENKAKGLRLLSLKSGVDPVEKLDLKRADLDVIEVFDAPLLALKKNTNLLIY
ncbi:hypothetical protein H0H87_012187 [Tephrocybe sp. NHM501043]|nr:hypothetical protein H0H87_012187 [Tephrocybe sp. NHM501043]